MYQWKHMNISDIWYPLANVHKTMKNHHCSWVNQLFVWPCSLAMLVYQRVQQNPVVPPTLLSLPSPHGTPPTKGPEKSHQVLPPLWTQHDLIIFMILDSPGYGSAIVNASPTIAKKLFLEGWIEMLWRTNPIGNAMQRYIKPYSVAPTSAWFSCTRNMVFPLWTLQNSAPQLVGRRQLLAWRKRTNPIGNAIWYPVALTASNEMASKPDFCISKRDPIEVLSRSDRGPKEPRTLSPNGKPGSKQTPTAAGSKKKPAAACRTQQQAESSKQKTQKTAAAAVATAAAATGRRIQQEEERYCRSTSSQPERSVWHLQVWNYRTVQRHIWDVKTMQLRENR